MKARTLVALDGLGLGVSLGLGYLWSRVLSFPWQALASMVTGLGIGLGMAWLTRWWVLREVARRKGESE